MNRGPSVNKEIRGNAFAEAVPSDLCAATVYRDRKKNKGWMANSQEEFCETSLCRAVSQGTVELSSVTTSLVYLSGRRTLFVNYDCFRVHNQEDLTRNDDRTRIEHDSGFI